MSDTVLDLITQAMSSPWLYAAIFAFAMLDAIVFVVPSETAVITAGVFAATGGPDLLPLIVAAAAGAIIGDHLCYALGYRYGNRLIDRLPQTGRQRTAFTWARNALLQRGGTALIVARYVPGGRTAVTLTTGAIRFPLRTFTGYDALAGVSWAVYCAMVGYLGGAAFEENPLLGVVLGLTLALSMAALIELVRARRHRSGSNPVSDENAVSSGNPVQESEEVAPGALDLSLQGK
jgi:membrane protein DedA with SNARE-associated domain